MLLCNKYMKVSGNSGARNRKWTNQVYAVYLQLKKSC
jgi:hypothetical protein